MLARKIVSEHIGLIVYKTTAKVICGAHIVGSLESYGLQTIVIGRGTGEEKSHTTYIFQSLVSFLRGWAMQNSAALVNRQLVGQTN